MTTVLSAESLSKRFRRVTVLDQLSMDVPEGSVFALVGSNGAGKTTTIKILMNIIRADMGSIRVLGTDSRKLGPGEFAQLGYVSENQKMPEWMSVGYLLEYLKPFYPTWDDQRVQELMRQFDLPEDRKLKHLSRGMRMKAALASSLAYRPKLLVLAEPFSGLDSVVRDELISGLLDCAGETTILISSHDLSEIESFASHVAYLDRGRLQFSEEMAALSQRFREIEVTVDSPRIAPKDVAWPATWLRPETMPAVVRFVESQFDQEKTMSEVRRLFGEVRQVSVSAMPLRNIFVTLARRAKAA
jgi:ABC-2 type transport system ATP-binding protein